MLTVLSNLAQYYMYLGAHQRFGTFGVRFGPALCVAVAAMLLMIHPTFFLLKDFKLLGPVCQNLWGLRTLRCCTHIGFILLFSGAMWATDGFQVLCKLARQKCCLGANRHV